MIRSIPLALEMKQVAQSRDLECSTAQVAASPQNEPATYLLEPAVGRDEHADATGVDELEAGEIQRHVPDADILQCRLQNRRGRKIELSDNADPHLALVSLDDADSEGWLH